MLYPAELRARAGPIGITFISESEATSFRRHAEVARNLAKRRRRTPALLFVCIVVRCGGRTVNTNTNDSDVDAGQIIDANIRDVTRFERVLRFGGADRSDPGGLGLRLPAGRSLRNRSGWFDLVLHPQNTRIDDRALVSVFAHY
jgi:hypothetical protein